MNDKQAEQQADTLQDLLALASDADAPDPLSSDAPEKTSPKPPKRSVQLRIPSPPPQPVPQSVDWLAELSPQWPSSTSATESKAPRKARLPLDMQERNLLLTLVPEPPTPRSPRFATLTPLTPLHRSPRPPLSTPPLTPYIRGGGVPWVDLSASTLPPPLIVSPPTVRSVRASEVASESFFQRLGPPRRPPFVGYTPGALDRPPSSCPIEPSGKKDPLSATAGLRRSPRGTAPSRQLPAATLQPSERAVTGSPRRGGRPNEGKEAHHHPPPDSYLASWKAHLTLSDDKSWLFYPPPRTPTATPRSPRAKAASAAAIAAATAAAAAAAVAAAADPLTNAEDYLGGASDEAFGPHRSPLLTQQTYGEADPSSSKELLGAAASP